ncbi:MAG: GrpB family protein [Candidatus Woesearchaeota archaeon]
MKSEKELVKIIKPSKEIFEKIDEYKEIVKQILPDSKIELIGSLAIPMIGKEEFDLLVEVDDVLKSQKTIEEKRSDLFGIGPIIDDEGYVRSKKKFGIICELHLLPRNHNKITNYKNYVRKLKENKEVRLEYENLKLSLNGKEMKYYRQQKKEFIKKYKLY